MVTLDCEDTIVGGATPGGAGSRSILRISGPQAHRLAADCLCKINASMPWDRRFVQPVTMILRAWGRKVMATMYSWPVGRSYTGQTTIEFHLPACQPLQAALTEEILRNGARLANPGEFTLRAFLAGRLDLLQAEAILGTIEAQSLETLRAAVDQRAGGLSRCIVQVREEMLNLLAEVEAGLDFADEDIQVISTGQLDIRLGEILGKLDQLSARLVDRMVERTCPRLVLVGPANAGKSSLFNALAGGPGALVSDAPGTTTDYVSSTVRIGEVEFELVDTAGFDDRTDDAARQREQATSNADVLLYCAAVDQHAAAAPLSRQTTLLVRTKSDLRPHWRDPAAAAHVSVVREPGTAPIVEAIRARIASGVQLDGRSGLDHCSARCRHSLATATTALADAKQSAGQGLGAEYIAVALRESLNSLGMLVGNVYSEDVLGRIFSRFCIGK